MREKAIETLSILRNSFLLESAIYDEEAEDSEVAKELEWVINELKQNPSRPVAHWIDNSDGGRVCNPFWDRYICSNCGRHSDLENYCCNCGAEMEDEE